MNEYDLSKKSSKLFQQCVSEVPNQLFESTTKRIKGTTRDQARVSSCYTIYYTFIQGKEVHIYILNPLVKKQIILCDLSEILRVNSLYSP